MVNFSIPESTCRLVFAPVGSPFISEHPKINTYLKKPCHQLQCTLELVSKPYYFRNSLPQYLSSCHLKALSSSGGKGEYYKVPHE